MACLGHVSSLKSKSNWNYLFFETDLFFFQINKSLEYFFLWHNNWNESQTETTLRLIKIWFENFNQTKLSSWKAINWT